MRLRRTAIAAVLAAGIVVPVLTPAVAFARPAAAGKSTAVLKSTAKTTKATKVTKPVKAVRFQASGTVSALNAATGAVTLQTRTTVKSGKKTTKKTVITKITVAATARVIVNDALATLADVAVGHRIVVTGTLSGSVYTATKVVATGKPVTPAPSPTVTPSPAPSETPVVEPTPAPSETPVVEPTTAAPTAAPSAEPGTTP